MSTGARVLAVALILGACGAARPGGAEQPACPSAQAETDIAPLPAVAAALHPGGTLDVLAIGSAIAPGSVASSVSPPASSAATAPPAKPPAGKPLPVPGGTPATAAAATADQGFPQRMAEALRQWIPRLQVNLTLRAARGMPAAEMLALLRQELAQHRYTLVLWQTGTVDAVSEVPPGDFYQTLSDGAGLVIDRGANLVLVDPQYSRFLESYANLPPYLSAMQAAGALPGVVLFHRFDLMREWADAGELDLEATPPAKRRAVAARLHLCLGRALARVLMLDAGLPLPRGALP